MAAATFPRRMSPHVPLWTRIGRSSRVIRVKSRLAAPPTSPTAGARYIQLDSRPNVMMGGGTAADCYIRCEAKLGVEAIEAELAREG